MPSTLSPQPVTADLPVRVYTPHSGLDAFRDALLSLGRDFHFARELAWRLFVRDTSATYRQSILGLLWLLVNPLSNTLVWVLLNRHGIVNIRSGDVPYPLFVLTGTVLWTAFNGSVVQALGLVGEARGMLSKVNFPPESLVYSALLKAGLDALIPTILLVPALLAYHTPWRSSMLLFPVALMGTLVLGAAIGLLLVPVAALYHDVGRGAQLALRFGFFVTPVIYTLPTGGFALKLLRLNPLTSLVVTGRDWLVESWEAMPTAFWVVFGGAFILLAVALIFFKIAMPSLIERLSS